MSILPAAVLASALLGQVVGQVAPTPSPAPPAATRPDAGQGATNARGISSWSDLDPAKVGPVRPLLVGRPELRLPPTKHLAFDRAAVGDPGAIVALSGTPHLAFLAFHAGRIELRTLRRTDGQLSPVITTLALREPPIAFREAPDGKTVVVRAEIDTPIVLVDAERGTVRAEIDPASAGPGDVYALDDTSIAVITQAGIVRRFAVADGASLGLVQLPPCHPIAVGRGVIVATTHMDPPNAPGVTAPRRMSLASFDATIGKEIARTELSAGPTAWTPRGTRIAVGEVEGGWTALRLLDMRTLQEISKVPLAPVVHSMGLELSPDGTRLWMQEYVTQPVIGWDTATGTAAAVVGPELGGYLRMDVSDDGRVLAGIVGPWVKGAIVPDAFEWTELAPPTPPTAPAK